MAVTKGKTLMNFEVTPEERAEIKRLADLHGLPVATYVRMKSLQDPIERIS